MEKNGSQLLIPPGMARPERAQRMIEVDVVAGEGTCPPDVRGRNKRLRVRLDRETLLQKPPGWLTTWSEQLESQNCIAKGGAPEFAEEIAESLPLDPAATFGLLYAGDIVPPVRIQVVSPIVRDPSKPILVTSDVAGQGNTLNLSVQSTDNLIGYETALYAAQSGPAGTGFVIAPRYAERHIQGQTERRAQPETNYFQFPPDVAFYRLFVKSGQSDFTALAIAALTREELDRIAGALNSGTVTCESLTRARCIAIPKRVAINAVIPVTINGTEVFVRWSADLGEAIRQNGARQPASVLGSLMVSRLYKGQARPIEFDRSNPAILRLTLMGGEVISWEQ